MERSASLQKCVGRCFAKRKGQWVQVWQTQPLENLFQPLPLVGDFDADGKLEIAILPFSELVIVDARTGQIKDRRRFTEGRSYGFFGAFDFDDDGRSEFLVQADFSKHIDVLGYRQGKLELLWQREKSGWQTWEPPLPRQAQSTAVFGRRTLLSSTNANKPQVVIRHRGALEAARWVKNRFVTTTAVTGPDLAAERLDEQGRMLIRCRHRPNEIAQVRISGGRGKLCSTHRRGGEPTSAAVVWPDQATQPTIVVQGNGEELLAFHPPQMGKGIVWCISGRGQSTRWPETLGPVLADIEGDGGRQMILAKAAPSGSARLVAADLRGREIWHHDFPGISGTPPIWNTGGIVLWQVGHFTDRRKLDVLVTIRRSMMHSEESVLVDGLDGCQRWRRDRQISHRGVGGAPFAIADFDGDGLEDAASLYPSQFYILKGETGRDLIAMDASWDGVPSKPVYWGQPAAGSFSGSGDTSIFFGGISMTGLVRVDGTLVWWDALDQGSPVLPAFGDFDGDGRLEAIALGYADGVRCYEAASGKINWRMPAPDSQAPVGSASADINSDGRDEALFVMGRTLFCLGSTPDGRKGIVLWRLSLPARTGPPSLAALDSSGLLSILLVGENGYVYCAQ